MASVKLAFELERQDRTFRPNETVRGKVVVTADAPVETKALAVTLNWTTAGRGNTKTGTEQRAVAFQGTLPAGESSHPFELVLPAGPLSYEGTLLQVRWLLEASVDIPWAIDPTARETLQLVPGSGGVLEIGDWQTTDPLANAMPRERAKMIAGGCGGCAFMGHGLVFATVGAFATAKDPGASVAPLAFGGIAILIGAMIFYFLFLRNFLAQRKLGPVTIDVTPLPARRGEGILVKVRFTPTGWVELNGAKATLVAAESTVSGSGKHRTTRRHELAKVELELSPATRITAGEPIELAVRFPIAPDAPVSFRAHSNFVEWNLNVHLDVAGWPDFSQDVDVIVLPSGYSLRGATS